MATGFAGAEDDEQPTPDCGRLEDAGDAELAVGEMQPRQPRIVRVELAVAGQQYRSRRGQRLPCRLYGHVGTGKQAVATGCKQPLDAGERQRPVGIGQGAHIASQRRRVAVEALRELCERRQHEHTLEQLAEPSAARQVAVAERQVAKQPVRADDELVAAVGELGAGLPQPVADAPEQQVGCRSRPDRQPLGCDRCVEELGPRLVDVAHERLVADLVEPAAADRPAR